MASTDIDVEHEWFIFERSLPDEVKQRLYEHQRAGVRWLHSLHFHPSAGGILGDDMGLG